MSKITFRADDDLVDGIESLDASKSEVMREALRAYLDAPEQPPEQSDDEGSLDAVVADRVDELVEQRLSTEKARMRDTGRDINVNVTLDGAGTTTHEESSVRTEDTARPEEPTRQTAADTERTENACHQCGEHVDSGHVYCPNCGEKASHRVFCDCGDELRSDWAFCPGCGRRTPSADVLDSS
ncbi:zinc ribbon domain-containing protein [Haladaptatus sp. DYF46]|uniref:double zinc ribbon domain-containing protein n=1 Tax=unclassified Haladaptatus TaxID=2622732 RepID=UPI001E60E866|nr:zinc ribbon domain-containing protein [Haladaptatus sp. DYF46]